MANFFIDYSESTFLTTSKTNALPNRLNWRAEMLLTRNQNLIEGKRVLDIASHDGRFSYACLKLGASHVTGVEGREELVKNSESNLKEFDKKTFNFIQGDIFDIFQSFKPGDFDTILCFGFLYHTLRQLEFFSEVKRLVPEALILDTTVCKVPPVFKMLQQVRKTKLFRDLTGIADHQKVVPKPLDSLIAGQYFAFVQEGTGFQGSTIDSTGIVAVPSEIAIEMLLQVYGFKFEKLGWNASGIKNWAALGDYRNGDRVSYVGRPQS
jgi:SAM-dependent methyltransferase